MNPVAAGTDEETIQLQKKIMRERREAAMKRRLEEEEREEAAKKERLRLKLEAMGPPPERKSAKKDENKDDSPTKPYLPPAQREGGAPPAATKAPSSPEKPDIPATVVENEKEATDDTISTAEAQAFRKPSRLRHGLRHRSHKSLPPTGEAAHRETFGARRVMTAPSGMVPSMPV